MQRVGISIFLPTQLCLIISDGKFHKTVNLWGPHSKIFAVGFDLEMSSIV